MFVFIFFFHVCPFQYFWFLLILQQRDWQMTDSLEPQLSIFKYVSSFCWTNSMKNNLQIKPEDPIADRRLTLLQDDSENMAYKLSPECRSDSEANKNSSHTCKFGKRSNSNDSTIFPSLFGWNSEKKNLIDWARADQRKQREGGTAELRRNWYVRDVSLNWGRINR